MKIKTGKNLLRFHIIVIAYMKSRVPPQTQKFCFEGSTGHFVKISRYTVCVCSYYGGPEGSFQVDFHSLTVTTSPSLVDLRYLTFASSLH